MSDGGDEIRPRRQRMGLAAPDLVALAWVGERHGFRTVSDTVRYCLSQQVLRDGGRRPGGVQVLAEPAPDPDSYRAVTRPVLETLGLPPIVRLDCHALSVWFYPEHDRDIARVMKKWDLNKSDAIRFAIRVQATLGGFVPAGGAWVPVVGLPSDPTPIPIPAVPATSGIPVPNG